MAVLREIQRINVLLVAIERVANAAAFDVPDTDALVFGTGSQELAIRGEAYRSNVKISLLIGDGGVRRAGDAINIAMVSLFALFTEPKLPLPRERHILNSFRPGILSRALVWSAHEASEARARRLSQ